MAVLQKVFLVLIMSVCVSQAFSQGDPNWGAKTSGMIGEGIGSSGGAVGPPWTMDFDGGQNIVTSESVAEDLRGYPRHLLIWTPRALRRS